MLAFLLSFRWLAIKLTSIAWRLNCKCALTPVERFGKYLKTLRAGIHILIPLVTALNLMACGTRLFMAKS